MSKYTIHKRKLQLWTNTDRTEYAIYITNNTNNKISNKNSHGHSNDELVIATKRDWNLPYTQCLDESDYLDELKYDWKYTLEQWIDNERNEHPITTADLQPFLLDENFLTQKQIFDADKEKKENSARDKTYVYINLNKYNVRRKNNNRKKIKCHFCKLGYLTKRDRTEHELAWHSNKSKGNGPPAVSLYDIKNGNSNSLTNAY